MSSNFAPFIVFIIVGSCVFLAFIAFWLRNFRQTARFARFGLTFVLIIMAADLTMVFLVGADSVAKSLASIIFLELLASARIYIYTVAGLLLASRLYEIQPVALPSSHSGDRQTSFSVFVPSKTAFASVALAVAFMLIYSTILFQLSDAKLGPALQGESIMDLGGVSALGLLAVATVGFSEEITFRLAIQNGLTYLLRSSRYAHHWAILCSSAFWSIGHIGAVDPDWAKLAQIFVFGLILGQMNRRVGIVPCMVTHALFNVIMATLTFQILGDGIWLE